MTQDRVRSKRCGDDGATNRHHPRKRVAQYSRASRSITHTLWNSPGRPIESGDDGFLWACDCCATQSVATAHSCTSISRGPFSAIASASALQNPRRC